MSIQSFPPVEQANSDGIVAIGGDLEVPSLKLAYESGIFPWPHQGYPLLWFAPAHRAILDFSELKIPKRLARELKKKKFNFKIDQNFSAVIQACAKGEKRKLTGTWITPDIIQAYQRFHQAGYAHSFECYDDKNQLIGGLYGVSLGSMFCAESMFFLVSPASKATLLYVCNYLQQKGAWWLDVQVLSPLLKSFGAKEIPRVEFMKKLNKALKDPPLLI